MTVTPEFSRLLALADLDPDGTPFHIEAGEAERAALARRFDLQAVNTLACEGVVAVSGDGRRLRVTGRLTAEVIQTCVVSLEPLTASVEVAVDRDFAVDAVDEWSLDAVEGGEIIIASDEEDAPEPVVGDAIDVGEMASEILALEIDPFPRRPGAAFAGYTDGGAGDDAADSPFAVLGTLRNGSRSDR